MDSAPLPGKADKNSEKIDVAALRIGMFVAGLDRPWLGTPFLLQGFLIEREEDLLQLRACCRYVFIDRRRSVGEHFSDKRHERSAKRVSSPAPLSRPAPAQTRAHGDFLAVTRRLSRRYPADGAARIRTRPPDAGSTLEEEMLYSATIVDDAHRTLEAIQQASDSSGIIALDKVCGLVEEMAASVERNPEALLWLTRLRTTDQYSYDHAVDVSVHLMVFGKFLGLGRRSVEELGQAGLMQDIGKVRIDPEILRKPSALTENEYRQAQSHVAASLAILAKHHEFSPEVIETVRGHHERHDGSGYPRSIGGDAIGINSELAGLIDTYCAMTRHRVFSPAISSQRALESLARLRGTLFRAALVDQFIQCVGLYPIGSLIELNSGEVAVVIQQNQVRRLKPRLLVLLAPDKSIERRPRSLDLIYEPATPTGEPYRIVKALPVNAYGIDPTEFFLG